MSLSKFNITCFKRENKKEGKIIRKLGEGSKGNVYLLEKCSYYFNLNRSFTITYV
jgi:hypothetical protein